MTVVFICDKKDFIDDSKMCHELYNVKPTYNYYWIVDKH